MMNKQLHLTIVCPEQTLFEGEVEQVNLPGTLGGFTVLADHAPLISSLRKGSIRYVIGADEQMLEIKSGFVEVKENKVLICAEIS